MTKQEIKDLVAAKIAGQGTQVDLGGALPTILNAILDAIPEGGASPIAPEPAIFLPDVGELSETPIDEAAAELGITVEQLISIPKQLVIGVSWGNGSALTRNYYNETNQGTNTLAVFGNEKYIFNINIDTVNSIVNAEFIHL